MDVVVLRWPEEETRRAALEPDGTPRLLLVDVAALPPVSTDTAEDWIRLPASDADIQARIAGLVLRCEQTMPPVVDPIILDNDGLLRNGDAWVALPPIDAALVEVLLSGAGAVVTRAQLSEAAWPGRQPSQNTLDVHMARLRRRLGKVGVEIRTIRSRGYVLVADRAGTT